VYQGFAVCTVLMLSRPIPVVTLLLQCCYNAVILLSHYC
jgi:hypothetical protein